MRVWLQFLCENEPFPREMLDRALGDAGVEVTRTRKESLKGPGLVFFSSVSPEVCDFLRAVSHEGVHRVLAIALSRDALSRDKAWRLLEAGASDVLVWDYGESAGRQIVARLGRWEVIDALVHSPAVQESLVGESPRWRSVLRQIVEAARFTEASVLITGESGTGKELVARLIHDLDPRPDKGEWVVVDCTTVVPTLSGSEFFGHEKGAFTGAVAPRDGAFAMADGGTLFLDEVGELPLTLQAELLRVIQEGMYKRVGSNTWRRTKFRLLCATNRDLLREQARGQFRRDLYYRIAAWSCHLPSLRERTEDIPLLASHFLKQARPAGSPIELDDPVRELLVTRPYPGNIRELRQLIFRLSSRHEGSGAITVGDVPVEERPAATEDPDPRRDAGFEQCIRSALRRGLKLREIDRLARDTAIRIAMAEEGGSLQRAARKLGITDRALQMRRAAHLHSL